MKKVLGIVTLLVVLLSVSSVVLAEDNYHEIAGPQSFMNYLRQDGDVTIKLVSDIIHTTTAKEAGEYWITLGKGKKFLDLNGFSAELNAETGSRTTMIRIPEGAELIINDSSGTNSGKLFCYGMIENIGDDYTNDSVKYRNVIEVDGGTLTVNGGTLEAGRSKEIWITNGLDVVDWSHQLSAALSYGSLSRALGQRFDGYAWQQVHGDCLILNNGSITINDGVFLGRGFKKIETYFNEHAGLELSGSQSAVIRAQKGILNINGGEFQARGNADVFALSKNAYQGGEVTGKIKAGVFKTFHIQIQQVPVKISEISQANHTMIIGKARAQTADGRDNNHYLSHVGSIYFPVAALDSATHTVELDGKKLDSSEWNGENIEYTWKQKKAVTVVVNSTSNNLAWQAKQREKHTKDIASVNVTGTMAQGMTLTPNTLTCIDTGVKAIKTTWYHGGAELEGDQEAYGGTYRAMVTLTAERGYQFTDKTRFVLMNRYPDETTLSEDGKYAYLWSTTYQFECDHRMNEDTSIHYEGSMHYQKCTVCGKIYSQDRHRLTDIQNNGNVTTYTCPTCGFSCDEENGRYPLNGIVIDVPVAQEGNTVPEPVVKEEYEDYAKVMSFEWHLNSEDGPVVNVGSTYQANQVYYLTARAKAAENYYFKPNAVMNCSAVATGTNTVDDDVIVTTYRIVAREKAVADVYMPAMLPGMTMETWIKGITSNVGGAPTSNMQIKVSKVGEDSYYFVKRNLNNQWSLYNKNGTLEEFFNTTIEANQAYDLELGFSSGKYFVADDAITFESDATYEGYYTEGGETWYTVYVVAKVSSNEISDISIVDVAEPEVGGTPDKTFSVSNTKGVTPAMGEWSTTSRFEAGKGYTFTAKVEVGDGYKLKANATATVYDEHASIQINGNEATITYTYPVLEKEVEVEVIPIEVKTETPVESPVVVEPTITPTETKTEENPTQKYWSKASDWAVEELEKASEQNLIPWIFEKADLTKKITRREFAYVAVKLYEKITNVKLVEAKENPFTDTMDIEVLKAYGIGITNGTSETTFTPDALITREQMATMMARALNKAGIDTSVNLANVKKFADDDKMHDWGKASIYYMSNIEIIKGVGDNTFDVEGNATREQALLISERSAEKFSK